MDLSDKLKQRYKKKYPDYQSWKDANGYNSCFHEDTLIWMGDGTEKPIKDIKVGEKVKGYDTYFEPHEYPGFDGASVTLNPIVDGVVESLIEKEVDELLQINFSHGKKLLVEPSSIGYARPLPCGTVEHPDGTVTEGCASEPQNNGVEGSISKYEAHACCNVGWMAVDLKEAISEYGEWNEEEFANSNLTGRINSDTFCGIDEGTGVYANEEFIVSDGVWPDEEIDGDNNETKKLFSLQQSKDYTIKSWEIVKGNFKVYNFKKVNDLQLIFANTVLFGAGELFEAAYGY